MFGLKLGLFRPAKSPPAVAAGSEAPAPLETSTPTTAASRLSPIASAVVLAAGAGVAFWWWTQWARGRAESEADLAVADETRSDADQPLAPD